MSRRRAASVISSISEGGRGEGRKEEREEGRKEREEKERGKD